MRRETVTPQGDGCMCTGFANEWYRLSVGAPDLDAPLGASDDAQQLPKPLGWP